MGNADALTAQRRLVEALADPACYPHAVDGVRLIETHISFVLLTGQFAYKIKKCVNLGFVDYSSLALRHHFCEEEVRLNRRLAPGLYLGVVAISGSPTSPQLGNGEAIEYAVKMVEFAQGDLLEQRLANHTLSTQHVRSLAHTLAAFHLAAPALAGPDPLPTDPSPASIWSALDATFAALRASVPTELLASLRTGMHTEFDQHINQFAQRKTQGWIRDCHGDLHLGNVLLIGDAPAAFDCIEFSAELRWIDVISDLAFLMMDLAAHGWPEFGWHLLNGWLEETADYEGLHLLRFYLCYRATVRAMVASLRAAASPADARSTQAELGKQARYLDYARELIRPKPGFILVTHGFSASGKTALAQEVAGRLGAVCLRSDVERKRLHGLPALARSGSALDGGIYTAEASAATYQQLAALADAVLTAGYPVIVDAACLLHWQREIFATLARRTRVAFFILDCHAPLTTLQQRILSRQGDASEATADVLARQIETAEDFAEDEKECVIGVDCSMAQTDMQVAEIAKRLSAPGKPVPS